MKCLSDMSHVSTAGEGRVVTRMSSMWWSMPWQFWELEKALLERSAAAVDDWQRGTGTLVGE